MIIDFRLVCYANKTEMVKKIIENYKTRLATWTIGILAYRIYGDAFDFIFYPFMMWKYGLVYGFIIMTPISFIICYLQYLFYDWLKKDWLAIETIKEVREYEGKYRSIQFLSAMIKKSDLAAFFFVSLKFDPFITVLFLRHGAHKYNGMNRRDWKIIISSALIGNAYWAIVTFTGVSIIVNFKQIWHYIVS